jgi:hypothetical protein
MKKSIITTTLLLSSLWSFSATAALEFINNTSIKSLIQFEADIGRDYTILTFSGSETMCRIPYTEDKLYTFALSLYMAGKKADFVCGETVSDPGGSTFNTRKVHRIIAI